LLGEEQRGASFRVPGREELGLAGQPEASDDREHIVGELLPPVAAGRRRAVAVAAEVEGPHVPARRH
jgi:hypothetical protein